MFDGFTSRCTRPEREPRPGRQPSGGRSAAPRTVPAALPIEPGLQRFAGDVLHHQRRTAGAARLDVVDRHDVLVHDGRRRLGLAGEPLAGRAAAGQVRASTLIATGRFSSVSKPLKTMPMPPEPISRSIS